MKKISRKKIKRWRMSIFWGVFGFFGFVAIFMILSPITDSLFVEYKEIKNVITTIVSVIFIIWMIAVIIISIAYYGRKIGCPYCNASKSWFDTVDKYRPYQKALYNSFREDSFVCPVCQNRIGLE